MHKHHSFDYIEIPVSDLTLAKKFYSSAFGFEFTDYGPTYSGIKGDGKEPGGLSVDPGLAGKTGGPLVVLYSDDIVVTKQAITSAGGEIIRDIFAFPGGKRLHFKDPSGNELAVWAH